MRAPFCARTKGPGAEILGLLGLDPGEADRLVPLRPVAVVADAVALLADDAGDRRRVNLAVPLDTDAIADLVNIGLRGLDGLGADLRGGLGLDHGALDEALDLVARDLLVPDVVVAVVVDLELGGARRLLDHRRI